MVLDIVHRNSIPFGKLLLCSSEFDSGDKVWKTPMNYMLARLFSNGMMREEMSQCNVDNLETAFKQVSSIVYIQVMSKSINEYVQQKCIENKAFVEQLLSTKSSDIVCDSFPKNIYGKILEQHRNRLQEAQNTNFCDRRQDPIFYMYLAEKALRELLAENNLQEYLDQKFSRMSDLIRYLEHKHGRERIIRKAPDRQTLLHIHKQLNVDYTTNPSALILLVRRKHIRRVRDVNMAKVKAYMFNEFVEHVKPMHSSRLEHRDAIVLHEKQSIGSIKRIEMTSRIYFLWKERKLPATLSKKIDAFSKTVYVPTDEEIARFESDVFALHPGNDFALRNEEQPKDKHAVFKVEKNSILHPNSVDYLIINRIKFPTCFHYFVFQFIDYEYKTQNQHFDKKKVLQKMNTYETNQLMKVLDTWIHQKRLKYLDTLADETLYIFFKDIKNQHLLLCTADEPLRLNQNIIPNLNEKMMNVRRHISPKIYRIGSLKELKEIYVVKEWCARTKTTILKLEKTFSDWFKAKGSDRVMTVRDVTRHFFFDDGFDSIDELFDFALKRLKHVKTDLNVVDIFLKMMYKLSNTWVKPHDYESLVISTSENMTLLALCKIIMVFDRLIDVSITINEVDVAFAKNVLINYIDDEQEFLCQKEENDAEEADDDDDEENIQYDDTYNDVEIEGSDVIYKYLLKHCYNNLSDSMETFIFSAIKTIDIPNNKNRINFFCGTHVK